MLTLGLIPANVETERTFTQTQSKFKATEIIHQEEWTQGLLHLGGNYYASAKLTQCRQCFFACQQLFNLSGMLKALQRLLTCRWILPKREYWLEWMVKDDSGMSEWHRVGRIVYDMTDLHSNRRECNMERNVYLAVIVTSTKCVICFYGIPRPSLWTL